MTACITIEDGATLPALRTIQAALLDGFASDAAVMLDVSQVVEADAGLVQLVEAARLHAAREGKSLALTAPAPAPVEALLRRAGFLNDPAADDAAFWLHGAA